MGVLDERGWDVKRGSSLEGSVEIAWGELCWRKEDGSAGQAWKGAECGNSLGRAPLKGARRECRTSVDGISVELRTSVDGMCSVEVAWGSCAGRSETGVPDECGWGVKRIARGSSAGRSSAARSETGVPDELGCGVKRGLWGAPLEEAR